MEKMLPIRPRASVLRSTMQFAIVASQYNIDFAQSLVDAAHNEISALEADAKIDLVWAPGTFELPLVIKTLAARNTYSAIVAFGVLIQGKTLHAELVARAVTDALVRIALDHDVPVIDGVVIGTKALAKTRCVGTEKNRGVEAARAAVTMARTMKTLHN